MSLPTKSDLENYHYNIVRNDISNNENKIKYFPKTEANLKIYNNNINKETIIQRPNNNLNYDNIRDNSYSVSDKRYKLFPNDIYLNRINNELINNINSNNQQNNNVIQQNSENIINETTLQSLNDIKDNNSEINNEPNKNIQNEMNETTVQTLNDVTIRNIYEIQKEQKLNNLQKEEKKCECCEKFCKIIKECFLFIIRGIVLLCLCLLLIAKGIGICLYYLFCCFLCCEQENK